MPDVQTDLKLENLQLRLNALLKRRPTVDVEENLIDDIAFKATVAATCVSFGCMVYAAVQEFRKDS